jgi:hypothetical protein
MLHSAARGKCQPGEPRRRSESVGFTRIATMIGFHADPAAITAALSASQPLPAVGPEAHFVFFAPGLPNLFRAATEDEIAYWNAPFRTPPGAALNRMVEEQILE